MPQSSRFVFALACLSLAASCGKPHGVRNNFDDVPGVADPVSNVTLAATKKNDGELCDTRAECKSNRCIIDDAGEFGHCGCGKSSDPDDFGQPCCPLTSDDFQQAPPDGKCTKGLCVQSGDETFNNRCHCGELEEPCCGGKSCDEGMVCQKGICITCGCTGFPAAPRATTSPPVATPTRRASPASATRRRSASEGRGARLPMRVTSQ
jgi:hypothetical protein